jgi:hypothetical protein
VGGPNVLASMDPTGGPAAWKKTRVGGLLADVSCASTLCLAVGRAGVAASGKLKAPGTKITGAKISSNKQQAKLRFKAKKAPASGFKCRLERKGSRKVEKRACTSPEIYRHLKSGRYVFEVRAKNAAGVDRSPARKKFKIKG